jgi:hypothetical protein
LLYLERSREVDFCAILIYNKPSDETVISMNGGKRCLFDVLWGFTAGIIAVAVIAGPEAKSIFSEKSRPK